MIGRVLFVHGVLKSLDRLTEIKFYRNSVEEAPLPCDLQSKVREK